MMTMTNDYLMEVMWLYNPSTEEERCFLETYDPNKYDKPSVTADIVIFTISDDNELSLLLIKRGGYPYKDKWAIPGGFVGMDESVDEAALRELEEETSVTGISVEQFGTFGEVDRDPRMRIISVAYMAFVPKSMLTYRAGDDAADAQLFKIKIDLDGIAFENRDHSFTEKDLAFDHAAIIKTAIKRLRNRIDYTEDAFKFLKDDQNFTIYELKRVYETVKGIKLDTGNFRRSFFRDYVDTGKIRDTGKRQKNSGHKEAAVYQKVR